MLGFYLGVDQEKLGGSLSVLGTFFGVFASLSLSLYSILTKKVLPLVKHDVWALSYYNNIYASIIFVAFMIINSEVTTIINYRDLFNLNFWILMSVGGVCGFAIGFFTQLQIKV